MNVKLYGRSGKKKEKQSHNIYMKAQGGEEV
jgi:hypothetical protein